MARTSLDGNEAAARVAYALSDTIAIYPITPASSMGELADAWAVKERPNLFGDVPTIVEMQSEGGAAGALHGAVTTGGLGTTFTASQGLLLMLPNMYKIAGELTPAVIHVAARTIATHALSIFGDHSDVMSARGTGFALLSSCSPQEAHDLAAVAHAATLRSRVPFLHFFDGFRTSHEINDVTVLDDDDLRSLIDLEAIDAHRLRGLSPERPVLRGTAQNPDVFFQAREASSPFYADLPAIVRDVMGQLGERTGRAYDLVEYTGHPEAERVVVLMGSGAGAARETVEHLAAEGERVGCVVVRLYRPFPVEALLDALPETVRGVAVLDRTKEPGASGEPLYQDVITSLVEGVTAGRRSRMPAVIGGRYGLSSKEFTPAMVKAVLDELDAPTPKNHFTVGIIDDVSHSSLAVSDFRLPVGDGDIAAVFYGLGADGTVGANKNTVKIIDEHTDLFTQGYFVYDSKKSGARTVSHLRFSPRPIRSSYLIDQADVVACHQFGFLDDVDLLAVARPGASVLINTPYPADELWQHLPAEVQQQIIDKSLRVHVIDAYAIAREAGLGGRINTVMQPCFFAVAGIVPIDEAVEAIGQAVRATYAKRGPEVIERNLRAVDAALGSLHEMPVPTSVTATRRRPAPVPEGAPEFVQRVTARIMAGEGDLLPVSALPVDGTFPTDTSRWEKRSIALDLPIWDPDICIDCGKCAIVCPHAAIQMKVFDADALEAANGAIKHKPFRDRNLVDHHLSIQVAPDDCTGCGVCVEVCPAFSKEEVGHRSINMRPAADHREAERERFAAFEAIPYLDRDAIAPKTIKGSQVREPLFTFSGACAGCGETPYLKLLSQLFGDRIVIANATGCSSIFGANLPTTPWSVNADGRGPAWSNSLFEDNAEFGLGMSLAVDQQRAQARRLVARLRDVIGTELADGLLDADQSDEAGIAAQRARVAELRDVLSGSSHADASRLAALADSLVTSDVWIIGGDGWAYDIGYGGLDHVLASGRNVNVLVLDTEVYSNTGGQASKATPRAAVAKFAANGKATPKKDLGLLAMQYGDVYVAQIAMGANEMQTIRALQEAAAWPGPSLVLAYATCIAHGVDMSQSMKEMERAVTSGYWPLYRYHPGEDAHGHPFHLDSKPPTTTLAEFARNEGRYAMLARSDPERSRQLIELGQADIDERWRYYEQLAGIERTVAHQDDASTEVPS